MIPRYNNSPAFPLTRRPRSLSHSFFVAPAWGAARQEGVCKHTKLRPPRVGGCCRGLPSGHPPSPKHLRRLSALLHASLDQTPGIRLSRVAVGRRSAGAAGPGPAEVWTPWGILEGGRWAV